MCVLEKPVIVEFPLRSEWMALNTSETKVSSRGIGQLGQRYAFDFLQVNWKKRGICFLMRIDYSIFSLKFL